MRIRTSRWRRCALPSDLVRSFPRISAKSMTPGCGSCPKWDRRTDSQQRRESAQNAAGEGLPGEPDDQPAVLLAGQHVDTHEAHGVLLNRETPAAGIRVP